MDAAIECCSAGESYHSALIQRAYGQKETFKVRSGDPIVSKQEQKAELSGEEICSWKTYALHPLILFKQILEMLKFKTILDQVTTHLKGN